MTSGELDGAEKQKNTIALVDCLDMLERAEVDRVVSDEAAKNTFPRFFLTKMLQRGGSFGQRTSDKERMLRIRIKVNDLLDSLDDYRQP